MLFDSLGMHANTPINCSCCLFSSARPLSCFLLFSQQECLNSSCFLNKNASTTQEWVRPLAQVDLMREGEEFSNLTAEINLDGWMRFGVSSLTLTLIIKLSFNLHPHSTISPLRHLGKRNNCLGTSF